MRITVKAKLVALLTAVVIAGSVSIGIMASTKADKALTESADKTLSEISLQVAKQVKQINDAEFLMLHALAELPEVKSEDVSIKDKCQMFRNIINANPGKYENIAFYDKDGNTALPNGAPLQLKGKPYIEGPVKTGEDYIQDPAFSTVNNAVIMFMSVPVYNNSGKAIGALVAVLKGNVLNDIAMGIEVTPGYHPNIINTKNKEIIANGNNQDDEADSFSNAASGSKLSEIISKICKGATGLDVFDDPATGTKQIASYRPVEGYNWAVFCPAPYDKFFGDLVTLNRAIIIIIIVTIAIAITVSIILIGLILKPLKNVQASITDIASGNADLTRRIDNATNDEIGDVVKGFNQFTEKLQSIMSELKSSKEDLTRAGETLSESTIDTSASITEIIANIESVHNQISTSGDSVSQTAAAVNQIASNIESLEKMIENQGRGISSASAAVEQMIANISSVNHSVDMMATAFAELYDKTIEGSKLQETVSEKIEQIRDQSETLQEANAVIASIASQTNLLAMNAAIEAAHAGEAGKGFSVVADEIRNLSSTSTAQSNTIGQQLEKIRDSIAEVVTESIKTSAAFESVTEKIKNTDEMVRYIKNAMNEQNEGSLQINESLHVMNDSTSEVTNASKEMADGNKLILQQMQALQNVTAQISSSMDEMTIGAKKINETGVALNSISDQIGTSISEIGNQVDLFKI